MSFPDELYMAYLDGRNWRVTKRFRYFLPFNGPKVPEMIQRFGVVVPADFETDFASIPRLFWRVLPPTGKYGKAAVIHDFLYRSRKVPKATADTIFLLAMEELGVSKPVRYVMYWAVRLFGFGAFAG